MISSWSYTKLIDFEQCPYRAKLKYLDRVPEAKSEAADRGTMIHKLAEDYVPGQIKKLPTELRHFAPEFDALRREYKAGHVSLEGEWGFDKDWMPAPWKSAWLRVKGDAIATVPGQPAVVIDYKTGARFGNEMKHGEQVQLYAIATFIRNPELKNIIVELWYLDKDELTQMEYTRDHALRYVQVFEKRALKLTTAKQFPANPNMFTCKWCPFGPNKGNQCEFGVKAGESPISMYRRKFG